jgi:ADP-ribose pyrophosphatase
MIVDRKSKYKGYLNIDEVTYRTKSGKEDKREVLVRKDAVAALVYDTAKDKYILVSQWRSGSTSEMLEIVAGTLDKPGEDTHDAMIREIEEEIGYSTDTIKLIDECYTSPGGSTELISIYFCEVSKKVSDGGGLENELEEIDIVEMDREDLLTTRFKDAKTIIAVNWARSNRNLK